MLDDEQWRRVADTGPELDHARAGAGDAALRDGASLAASKQMRWDNARGETAGGASETTGERVHPWVSCRPSCEQGPAPHTAGPPRVKRAGSAETTGQAGSAPDADLNWPGRRKARRDPAMELLRTRNAAAARGQATRRRADAVAAQRHAVTSACVRAPPSEVVPHRAGGGWPVGVEMQRTSRGLHPTMKWTVQLGEWLATTRILELRAYSWHLAEEQSAGQTEATARSGRGSNTVYVALQHMKNHV